MTKRFCDLCCAPAVEESALRSFVTPIEGKGSVRMVVLFQWDYPTTTQNAGDRFDLCADCLNRSLLQSAQQIQGTLKMMGITA